MTNDPSQGSERPAGDRAGSIAELAGELVRLAQDDPAALARRIAALSVREQAELALRLPAAQRLELLLHAPRPMPLVRALPDAELYLTVREVGPADALPLLGLASAVQIQHLVDLEAWRGDRFDGDRTGAWMAVLLEAGEPALRGFLRRADDEFLALLFHRWLRVEQIEYEDSPEVHGHGEGDAGTERGYPTPDGYHRFRPTIADHVAAARQLLQVFFQLQPHRYQQTLWSALWELPSDLEERALRWRQARLEEHGFPPWDEALAIYLPPAGNRTRPPAPEPVQPGALAAARSPLRLPSTHGELVPAIDHLDDTLRERVLHELVSLANHVLVAETEDTGDPAAHRRALETAAGYVDIALRSRAAQTAEAMGGVLGQVPILELFREGYAEATELQQRARQLIGSGWAAAQPRALELLDSPLRERILGLLEPRPRFGEVAGAPPAPCFRPLRSAAELEAARAAIEMAELFGRVLVDSLGLDVAQAFPSGAGDRAPAIGFSGLLLTMLAWHATRDELRCAPLPADVVADFLRTVASRRTAAPEAPGRAFEALARRLTVVAGLGPRETAALEAFGRFCVERLAEQCATLDPGVRPDPRDLTCLLIDGGDAVNEV